MSTTDSSAKPASSVTGHPSLPETPVDWPEFNPEPVNPKPDPWGRGGAAKTMGVERDHYANPHAVTYETTTMEVEEAHTRGIYPTPAEIKQIVDVEEPVGVHVIAKPVTEGEFPGPDPNAPGDGTPPAPNPPTLSTIAPINAKVGD